MADRPQRKKFRIRGAQILCNDTYLAYVEAARDAAQQRIWTFYAAVIFCLLIFGVPGCFSNRISGGKPENPVIADLESKAGTISSYAYDYTINGRLIKRMYFQFEKNGKPFYRFREDLTWGGKKFVYIYNADGKHDYHYYPDQKKAYRCPTSGAWNETNYINARDWHFGYQDAGIIGEDVISGKSCYLLAQHNNVYAVWKEKGVRLAKKNNPNDNQYAVFYDNMEFNLSDDIFTLPPDVVVIDQKKCTWH